MDAFDAERVAITELLGGIDWSSVLDREIDVTITSRTKTHDTLLDKLRRTNGITLATMRDISGVRMVGDFLLAEQDVVAAHVGNVCGHVDPKFVDRRKAPAAGYRALHVAVARGGISTEVQIRSELQAMWANMFERLADKWGRGIRYGEPPTPDRNGDIEQRVSLIGALQDLSLHAIASAEDARQAVTVGVARLEERQQHYIHMTRNPLVRAYVYLRTGGEMWRLSREVREMVDHFDDLFSYVMHVTQQIGQWVEQTE